MGFHEDNQYEEVDPNGGTEFTVSEDDFDDGEPEDELSKEFVSQLIDKIMTFGEVFVGHKLHTYQLPLARRIIESVIINDGDNITATASRQSGKTEVISFVVSTLMVILPRLAKMFPDLLGKFKDGVWVGMFAPVEAMVETLYGRTVDRLTSELALEILGDPEIDDITARTPGVTKGIKLQKSGSTLLMMTANPRAKIESKSFHIIFIDEAQAADDFVVSKSIFPMGAYYNATVVETGTPTTTKNHYYRNIQLNKRMSTGRRGKQNHFQWDWREVAKVNPNYEIFVKKEMLRIGEDSDEFQLSYAVRWLLERGMFVSSSILDHTSPNTLGDVSMETVKLWQTSPCIVGIDPARKSDSTVVTVVWVDWDRPDEFGFYEHRILNWLEIQGDDWEEQYYQIVSFLANYSVLAVAVDGNGVGDAVAQRLKLLLPQAEVSAVTSSLSEQSARYKHLQAILQRKMLSWPAHAKSRRLRTYRRFIQQMGDAEIEFKGPNFSVAAPDEAHAHDDYVDSLSLACSITKDLTMPHVESSSNFLYR